MKHIPLLLSVMLLTGCAASTDQLHADAMGCGKQLIIESNGIVRKPTEQEKSAQCKPLWDIYNERQDIIFKRQEKKRHEQERLQADRAACGGRVPVYKGGVFWGCLERW